MTEINAFDYGFRKAKEKFMLGVKPFRPTADVLEAIKWLRLVWPELYDSDSAVIRAGVLMLYNDKKAGSRSCEIDGVYTELRRQNRYGDNETSS